jgi:hypothetical protein
VSGELTALLRYLQTAAGAASVNLPLLGFEPTEGGELMRLCDDLDSIVNAAMGARSIARRRLARLEVEQTAGQLSLDELGA